MIRIDEGEGSINNEIAQEYGPIVKCTGNYNFMILTKIRKSQNSRILKKHYFLEFGIGMKGIPKKTRALGRMGN